VLSLLKRYRELLLIALLLLYPFVAFLTTDRRGREPHFLDRALIGLSASLQRVLVGGIDGVKGVVEGYLDLRRVREENERLRLENLRLLTQVHALGEARLENERLHQLLQYVEPNPGPEIVARVVGVNPVSKLLSVRINRGEKDGVLRGMSVVTPQGIVGQVVRTTGGYADVALVTDPQSRVAVRVQRSRARGTAAGAGSGPLRLETVLRVEDVKEGDTIVTSGTDAVHPPGLVVGQVVKLDRKDSGMFITGEIVPAVDTSRLEEVLVVPNPFSLRLAEGAGGER
jgi:rod shape-determining protein MreC